MKHHKKHSRKPLLCLSLLAAATLLSSSCGLRDDPEPFSSSEKGSAASVSGSPEEQDTSPIPVAEFQYIKLDADPWRFNTYTFNQEWLYYANTTTEKEDGDFVLHTSVCQNRIFGEGQIREFISDEERGSPHFLALLADRDGNCFTFGEDRGNEAEGIPPCFVMEKRSPEGILQWHREYAPEELDDRGSQLTQGTIAQDGRIYLYTQGAEGKIFIFGKDGMLEDICAPKLDTLDGIAAGAGGSVYGYCAAGDAASFVRLDNPEETYVCPMVPKQIFDGHEDGVYLSDNKSLWSYTPESAETKKLWDWNDEYVQISAAPRLAGTSWETLPIAGVFKGEDTVTVLCMEQKNGDYIYQPVLTFASISFQDRSKCPERKVVTLGLLPYQSEDNQNMRDLVRRYNRLGREYKVELTAFDSTSALIAKIFKGEGPDLVEVSLLGVDALSGSNTALEDLTDYYAASETVSSEDILPAVRDAGFIMGRNVLVIPSFYISCLDGMKELPELEEWTVWSFLAMGRENRMFQKQSPLDALLYCMGVRKGDHFIDYEKMECHFDSPEFRRVLEECLTWETYDGNDPNDYVTTEIDGQTVSRRALFLEEGASWLFNNNLILNKGWNSSLFYNISSLSYEKSNPRTYVGYPGWEGAEYELMATDVFAMTSSSQNKEGAWDFLEYLLSPELQDSISREFPARTDSLEAQLAEAQNSEEEEFRHTDEEFAYVRRIIDSAVYNANTNRIWFIISEEAQMYFAGHATLDATVNKIQNRVQNYLNELGG